MNFLFAASLNYSNYLIWILRERMHRITNKKNLFYFITISTFRGMFHVRCIIFHYKCESLANLKLL